MALPLTPEEKADYNNVPTTPQSNPLGDILDSLESAPAPITVNTTFYVDSDTGSDDTGDGSVGNPWRTVTFAFSQIADGFTAVVQVELRGATTHEIPGQMPTPAGTGQFVIYGDRSSPTVTNNNPTFAQTAGFSTVFNDAAFGAYTDTITDTSHWGIIPESVGFGRAFGFAVQASTSPALNIVAGFNLSTFAIEVYPYTTSISFTSLNGAPNTYIVGCRVDDVAFTLSGGVGLISCLLDRVGFRAARLKDGTLIEGVNSDYTAFFCTGEVTVSGVCANITAYPGCRLTADGIFFKEQGGSVAISVEGGAFADVSTFQGVDVDYGAGVGDLIFSVQPTAYLRFGGGTTTLQSTPDRFLSVAENGVLIMSIGHTAVGSVNNNGIELDDGVQASGIEAACNGTLTCGGNDVVVGATPSTFAGLPVTDATTFTKAS
jgi:hypothetical protein